MSGTGSKRDGSLVEPLTRRERDILTLLAQGHTGPEIAEELTLAVSSDKWHAQHLESKLAGISQRRTLHRPTELVERQAEVDG